MSKDIIITGLKDERIRLDDKSILNYRLVPATAADVNEDIRRESPQCDLFDEILLIDGREIKIKTILEENPHFVYLEDLKLYLNKYGYNIEPPLI